MQCRRKAIPSHYGSMMVPDADSYEAFCCADDAADRPDWLAECIADGRVRIIADPPVHLVTTGVDAVLGTGCSQMVAEGTDFIVLFPDGNLWVYSREAFKRYFEPLLVPDA